MSLNYVTLTLDLYDGQGGAVTSGVASLTPSAVLRDAADGMLVVQAPVRGVFSRDGFPAVRLLATDSSALTPGGWTWAVSFAGVPGDPAAFSFSLPYADGAAQRLSAVAP